MANPSTTKNKQKTHTHTFQVQPLCTHIKKQLHRTVNDKHHRIQRFPDPKSSSPGDLIRIRIFVEDLHPHLPCLRHVLKRQLKWINGGVVSDHISLRNHQSQVPTPLKLTAKTHGKSAEATKNTWKLTDCLPFVTIFQGWAGSFRECTSKKKQKIQQKTLVIGNMVVLLGWYPSCLSPQGYHHFPYDKRSRMMGGRDSRLLPNHLKWIFWR